MLIMFFKLLIIRLKYMSYINRIEVKRKLLGFTHILLHIKNTPYRISLIHYKSLEKMRGTPWEMAVFENSEMLESIEEDTISTRVETITMGMSVNDWWNLDTNIISKVDMCIVDIKKVIDNKTMNQR